MRSEIISSLTKSFEESAYQEEGVEYWLARDLQKLLDYAYAQAGKLSRFVPPVFAVGNSRASATRFDW